MEILVAKVVFLLTAIGGIIALLRYMPRTKDKEKSQIDELR
jgi:energy-converting hydrogenase Eha subunit C